MCVCVRACVCMHVHVHLVSVSISVYVYEVINYKNLGKMFRIKLDLPEWKIDEDIARHLLKLVCESLILCMYFYHNFIEILCVFI